jgi:S-adenosylmethionine decarboxylase proenzyme
MASFGIHLLVELGSCNREKIDSAEYLEKIMAQAAEIAGATVLTTAFQTFNPQGVSGVVVIAESHLTVHTWPEYGYAAVDIFTCGDSVDPWKAAGFMRQSLEAQETQIRDFRRGLPVGDGNVLTGDGVIQDAACGSAHC